MHDQFSHTFIIYDEKIDLKRRAVDALSKMFNEDDSLAPEEEEIFEDEDDISIIWEWNSWKLQ